MIRNRNQMLYQYKNGVDSLFGMVSALRLYGENVSPRGIDTFELRNVTICIDDPTDATMLGIGRNWNADLAAAEALQLIGGFSDAKVMVNIAPNFAAFLDPPDFTHFHGAYGPRTSYALQTVYRRLSEDPDSRQGVVTLWHNERDAQHHPDLPCTVYLNFTIRDGKLFLTTHMRSNDVWWGWCYDLFQFTQLQLTMARALNVDIGDYVHVVDSFHMYVRDIDASESLTRTIASPRPSLCGLGRSDEDWGEMVEVAHELFYDLITDTTLCTETEAWYADRRLSRYGEKV